MQQPSVGRIVHYVSYGTPPTDPHGFQAFSSACRAAVITEVSKEHSSSNGELAPKVSLCVLNPTGQFFNQDVSIDTGSAEGTSLCDGLEHRGGTWHWPART